MSEIKKYEDVGVIDPTIIENVVMKADLSQLSAPQRLSYYNHICQICKLDPSLKPFDYITLQGKLTLYANKTAASQLRRVYGVSVTDCDTQVQDGIVITKVTVRDHKGRVDSDVGVVSFKGSFGLDNAIMKSVTKAKRRATLSICGLGMLDETEIETVVDEPESKCKSSVLFNGKPEAEPKPEVKLDPKQPEAKPLYGQVAWERFKDQYPDCEIDQAKWIAEVQKLGVPTCDADIQKCLDIDVTTVLIGEAA